jgi:hypothetical protein
VGASHEFLKGLAGLTETGLGHPHRDPLIAVRNSPARKTGSKVRPG